MNFILVVKEERSLTGEVICEPNFFLFSYYCRQMLVVNSALHKVCPAQIFFSACDTDVFVVREGAKNILRGGVPKIHGLRP